MTLPRIAILCDFKEENWPSMDLVADMLLTHLKEDYSDVLIATRICPPMRRRLTRQRAENRGQRSGIRNRESDVGAQLFNADRVMNRFWDYPRFARRIKDEFDLFHLVDHSYGQLLHDLPPDRTIVTCHDLDTFQCLLEPEQDPRSIWFKKMMSRTLSGFKQAALVTCDSAATRDELLSHRLVEPGRTVVVPNGIHPSCSPQADPLADGEAARLLASPPGAIDLLHVGSTIPRKRIDILLQVFRTVRNEFPAARLIRVGGAFTREQQRLVDQLDLARSIVVLPQLERNVLAAVYRRAALVLLPSEREGFGLPVVEAFACGTPVVAADLPVLREVGGDAAVYAPVAEVAAWSDAIRSLLGNQRDDPEQRLRLRQKGIAQAAKFSWAEYSRKMVALYSELGSTL
jgi:glycosyltransferase involved in cell wall biosynthesis